MKQKTLFTNKTIWIRKCTNKGREVFIVQSSECHLHIRIYRSRRSGCWCTRYCGTITRFPTYELAKKEALRLMRFTIGWRKWRWGVYSKHFMLRKDKDSAYVE